MSHLSHINELNRNVIVGISTSSSIPLCIYIKKDLILKILNNKIQFNRTWGVYFIRTVAVKTTAVYRSKLVTSKDN